MGSWDQLKDQLDEERALAIWDRMSSKDMVDDIVISVIMVRVVTSFNRFWLFVGGKSRGVREVGDFCCCPSTEFTFWWNFPFFERNSLPSRVRTGGGGTFLSFGGNFFLSDAP